MKKLTKNILITLGIISAIVLIAYFGKTFAITSQELGWYPFEGVSDSSFTQRSDINVPGVSVTYASKFWNAYFSGSSDSRTMDGTDNNVAFYIAGGQSQSQSSQMSIKFNENLKGKNVKIDYKAETYSSQYNEIGSISSNVGVLSGSGTIEINPSLLNEDEFFVLINGINQGIFKYSYFYNKGFKDNTINSNEFNLIFTMKAFGGYGSSKLTLYNPRWKPIYDCNVSNDAVLIFDEFTEGSRINITSLSYPVKQWCINQPVVIRSFTQGGIATDTSNQLLLQLSAGANIVVPSGKTYRIPYITKVQTGLIRCSLNQAFNTKTNKCENILSEPTIDSGGSYISQINVGDNEISYSQNYQTRSPIVIGDISLDSSAPSYTCSCTQEGRITPDNTPECWQISINQDKVNSRTNYKINDYLTLYYETQGAGVFNGVSSIGGFENTYLCTFTDESDWINAFKLTINLDGLRVISVPSLNTTIIPGNKYIIQIGLENNLANFQESGFKIRTINNIIGKITESEEKIPFVLGIKNYPITITTELAGDTTFEIVPFVIINGKKFYGSSKATYSYIEKNITETITLIQNCNNVGCTQGTCQSDGNCLVKTISDCKLTGCTQGTCQSDGNCLVKTISTITQSCKELGCKDGVCMDNGNCLETKIEIKQTKSTAIYFVIGGILLVIILLLGVLFWLRRK